MDMRELQTTETTHTYVSTYRQTLLVFFNWQPVGTDAQLAPPGESKYNYSSTSYTNTDDDL